ncbi:MAG: signal peptide peptidase SppA [Myxococcaceae bacterium]
MRWLVLGILNLLTLLRLLPGLPFRVFSAKRKPLQYVRFTLKGDPPWRRFRKRSLFARRPEPGEVTSLYELSKQLELLSEDRRIEGVILDVEGLELSSAKRKALTDAIDRFRGKGKKVIAHAVSVGNIEYELLCAADTIALAPAGRVDLVGFAAEATAIAEGLEKLGIRAEFIRRGEYKTAPELFTHKRLSDVQRQTLEMFLDERYGELLSILTSRRKLTDEQARAKIDKGPYSAKRAFAEGLADVLVARAELPVWLQTGKVPERPLSDEHEEKVPRIGTFARWARLRAFPLGAFRKFRRRPQLALVPVTGMITGGEGGRAPVGPEVAGQEGVLRALKSAAEDDASAVLLYISSPGGSAVASEIILEQVQRLAAKKPVIAWCDRVAASGGYMAALGAKEIWSSPGAVIGSIGVFAGKFDASELLQKVGIHRETLRRGANSAIFSGTRGFTEQERAAMEADIEETYQAFLEHVARSRKRTREEIHARGEGRVFSAERALAEGLVDKVGSFEEACAHALSLGLGKVVPEFDVVLHSASPANRFNLLSLLTLAQTAQVYALEWPLLAIDGSQGSENFRD